MQPCRARNGAELGVAEVKRQGPLRWLLLKSYRLRVNHPLRPRNFRQGKRFSQAVGHISFSESEVHLLRRQGRMSIHRARSKS